MRASRKWRSFVPVRAAPIGLLLALAPIGAGCSEDSALCSSVYDTGYSYSASSRSYHDSCSGIGLSPGSGSYHRGGSGFGVDDIAILFIGGVALIVGTVQVSLDVLDAAATGLDRLSRDTQDAGSRSGIGDRLSEVGDAVAEVMHGALWVVTRPVALVTEEPEEAPASTAWKQPPGEDPYVLYTRLRAHAADPPQ